MMQEYPYSGIFSRVFIATILSVFIYMGSDNGVEQLKNFFSQKIDIGIRQFRPFALNEPQEFFFGEEMAGFSHNVNQFQT
jgi:hypothetical protein